MVSRYFAAYFLGYKFKIRVIVSRRFVLFRERKGFIHGDGIVTVCGIFIAPKQRKEIVWEGQTVTDRIVVILTVIIIAVALVVTAIYRYC
jgi:hypothetical protein